MTHYDLQMIECSSCGNVVGHLFDDYYALRARLQKEINSGRDIPSDQYVVQATGDDIGPFLRTFYTWVKETVDEDPDSVKAFVARRYQPANIVARAMLRLKELDKEELPFGSKREADGQHSRFEPRICCLRMLGTDPTGTDN